MKKSMIITGALTAILLSIGIVFKYMHAPGASFLITVGLLIAGFVFMPVLFSVRVKEKTGITDKVLYGISTLAWISAIIGVLFKVQHWPGAVILFYSTPFILLVMYLPFYFFAGIRRPEIKLNTVAYSTLIVISCGLFFTLTVTPTGIRIMNTRYTKDYLRGEEMLKYETKLLQRQNRNDTGNAVVSDLDNQIYATCEDIKSFIIEQETGNKVIGADFESKDALLPYDRSFNASYGIDNKLEALEKMIVKYNETNTALWPIPFPMEFKDMNYKVNVVLNGLMQVQMIILQNQRKLKN